MRHRTLAPGIAILLTVTAPAATMTVTMSPSPPPASDVIVGFDVQGDVGCYLCSHGTATVLDLGQTFRSPVSVIWGKITLKVRALTEETPGESVTLFLGTFSDIDDTSMDEVLAAETWILPPELQLGEVTYLTFDFSDIHLEAARQYGFRLAFTGGGCVKNARLELLHVGEDAYPEGLAVETAGTIPSPLAYDLVFFIRSSSLVFADGFESGDTGRWTTVTGGDRTGGEWVGVSRTSDPRGARIGSVVEWR